MKKNLSVLIILFALSLSAYAGGQQESGSTSGQQTSSGTAPAASGNLNALLRTARSEIQRWNDNDGKEYNVTVYSLDISKKDELFQAVKDAGYYQTWTGEYTRDWELQRGVLRWCVPADTEKWDRSIQFSEVRSATVYTYGFIPAPDIYWTRVPQNRMPDYVGSVAYGNGKFVAVGPRGNMKGNNIAYSTDGINWTKGSIGDEFGVEGITFSGGRFFIWGWPGTIASSTDGENWTVVVSNLRDDIRAPAYGNGKWVFVTYAGRIYYTDGITMTAVTNRPSGLQYSSVAYGSGKFVACASGRMVYSIDGVTWTTVPGTFGTGTVPIFSITYADGRFIAGGWGRIWHSADGITWTELEFIRGSILYDTPVHRIAYGGGKFIACGDGKMAYSTNGITWTTVNVDVFGYFSGGPFTGIAYGAGRFVLSNMALAEWSGYTVDESKIAYSNKLE